MNIEKHNVRKEIHKKLKQHSPKAVHKAKKIVGFKYLKLTSIKSLKLAIACFILHTVAIFMILLIGH